MEIPIELARRVQRRPVISVLGSSRLTRGNERFTFKGPRRRDAHTRMSRTPSRMSRLGFALFVAYRRITSEILCVTFFNFSIVSSLSAKSHTLMRNMLIPIYILPEITRRISVGVSLCAECVPMQWQPSNAAGEFSISSISSVSSTVASSLF